MLRRMLAAAAVAALTGPAAALAHEGNPNYRSEVTGPVPGIEARVLDFDDRLEIEVEPGHRATVEGYEGEPYVRVLADGRVEINRRAPTAYLNEDRFAEVEVPESADPKAEPDWEPVAEQGRYGWHDHRIHYMARGLPPAVEDGSRRTKVFDWTVPIVVDGEPRSLAGTLTWVPDAGGVSTGLLAGLATAVLAALGFSIWRLRRRPAAERGQAW